jgi:site-specific recombinase XerD
MRRVIRRFLKHFDAEKNATIESYRYDLLNSISIPLNDWEKISSWRCFPRPIRDYLMWLSQIGHQKPSGPSTRAGVLAVVRSCFKYAHGAAAEGSRRTIKWPLNTCRSLSTAAS